MALVLDSNFFSSYLWSTPEAKRMMLQFELRRADIRLVERETVACSNFQSMRTRLIPSGELLEAISPPTARRI
jgi:hypothetical protein